MSRRHNKCYLPFLLFLVAAAVYANSLSSGFVWDDNPLVVGKQEFFNHPKNAVVLLTSPDAALGARQSPPYYRPLDTLSYMLDHYLWGTNPLWYHLENLMLHGLAAILFYLLLVEVFEDRTLAFIVSILFAVYPVNAETVDFVSARNTLFCAFFSLASLLLLAKGKKAISLLAYFLALLSKEPAVVLPFFLLSMGLTGVDWKISREKGKSVLAGFFAVTAAYFMIRHLILGAFIAKHGMEFSFSRLKLISAVYYEHFRLMLFPFRLNALYTVKAVFFSPFRAAAATVGVLLLLYFSLRKKSPPPVRAGAQWIFWGLLPVSNIVKIPSASVAERFQYMVVMGFVLVLGYLLRELQKKKMLVGVAVSSVLALALGARTFERNFVWRSDISLYASMIRSDPSDAIAYYNLGNVYGQDGDLKDAAIEFRTALAVDPGYVNARLNLGVAYAKEGRLSDAIRQFMMAETMAPSMSEPHLYLGTADEKEGLMRQAESEFQTALMLDPGDVPARRRLERIERQMRGL